MQTTPLIGEKKRDGECSLMSSSRIRRIQKAHIAFVPSSVAKREKYEIRAVDKKMQTERHKAKQRQQYSTGQIFLSGERNFASHKSSPVELFAFVG